MKMTPPVVVLGVVSLIAAMILVVVYWPYAQRTETPSEIFRPLTVQEVAGKEVFMANGCVYCHSQAIRNFDQDLGSDRIAQEGDYIEDKPNLLGEHRTGPDLSQEGGEHPDDWHQAHFTNPRYPRPNSLMPPFEYLGQEKFKSLTRYVQALGRKQADRRMERQNYWKKEEIKAYEAGPDANVNWLHSHAPEGWRKVTNPYSTSDAGLVRGHKTFQDFCIGCHGPIGDGMGPAEPYLYPPPLNFTILKGRGISGGILYYQIMNGITGTAMPYFKRELESQKIWEVGNYVAVYFINQTDAGTLEGGIKAALEP